MTVSSQKPECITEGCDRPQKYTGYGLCPRCYQRKYVYRKRDRSNEVKPSRAKNPWLPTAPLIRYMEAKGVSLYNTPENDIYRNHNITLWRADRICCEVLKVHPYEVFGEAYWQCG